MDHFFTEYENAYNVARAQRRTGTFQDLEICYYSGEKQNDDEFSNLIHVPLEEIYDYFSETPNRIPNNFVSGIVDQDLKNKVKNHVLESVAMAWTRKNKICDYFKEEVYNLNPDFSEPLRILFITSRITTVGQYVTNNIAEAFNQMGYETFVSMESNDMQTWGVNDSNSNANFAWHLRNILNFNPHIIFNVNWLYDSIFNDKIFTFSWFQDEMPILHNDTEITPRDREYFFCMLNSFKKKLLKKGIAEEKIFIQHMATNKKIFFKNDSIQKEKKIVFLGGDYGFDQKVSLDDDIRQEIIKLAQQNRLTLECIKKYHEKTDIEFDYFYDFVIPAVIRRETVLWICNLKDIKVEVYGPESWLKVDKVAPFYKGLLPYGKEMADVYNSATYALVSHSIYRYQQRLFEISACGTIPIVYKGNQQQEDFIHEENVLTFNTPAELQELIGQKPQKDPKQISEDINYEKLAEKVIEIVKQKIKNENS